MEVANDGSIGSIGSTDGWIERGRESGRRERVAEGREGGRGKDSEAARVCRERLGRSGPPDVPSVVGSCWPRSSSSSHDHDHASVLKSSIKEVVCFGSCWPRSSRRFHPRPSGLSQGSVRPQHWQLFRPRQACPIGDPSHGARQ
jgi:hypothetical protein